MSEDVNGTRLPDFERCPTEEHHHRGKSSEHLFDKGAILAVIPVRSGHTVLDAGCGNGYMAKEFSKRIGGAGTVYALDPDERAIAALCEETSGTNVVPLVGDITRTTALPPSTCDLIYLSMVVHGFSPEQFRGFKTEVKRLLAPGGILAVLEIVKQDTPFGPPLNRRLSPKELEHALSLPVQATIEIGDYGYIELFTHRQNA